MSRPKSDRTRRDRTRQQNDLPPVFGRRGEVARLIGVTEGYIRHLEARGIGPAPIRLEGSKVVLHDLNEWITWVKRNQQTNAA